MTRNGGWMVTYTGRQFWPMEPDPQDVCIDDIAHGLAFSCRYNGHTKRFYSIAQHSVYVADWLRRQGMPINVQMAGLLHDAPEAYLGDIIRPIKRMMQGVEEAEDKIYKVICEGLGLSDYDLTLVDIVHLADNVILMTEVEQLIDQTPELRAQWLVKDPPDLSLTILPQSPETAERDFLWSYNYLQKHLQGSVD